MDFSESGPVDIFMLSFVGSRFRIEMASALRELSVTGLVRVIDLLFVFRTVAGEIGSLDLDGLRPHVDPYFSGVDGQLVGGLLDAGDVDEVAPGLAHDTSIVIVVVEYRWAVPFVAAVRRAGGRVVDRARMSPGLPASPPAPSTSATTGPVGEH